MPLLPYDTAMSETDIMSVMFYPGDNEFDRKQRRAMQARVRQKALGPFIADGGKGLSFDWTASIIQHAEDPARLDERKKLGQLMGQTMLVLHALHHQAPELISWNRAINVTEALLAGQRLPHSKRTLQKAKSVLEPAAHLWGAFASRGNRIRAIPDVGYTASIDFRYFLWEAEQLRWFGMGRPPANEPKRRLFNDAGWHMPEDWRPPEKQLGWPDEAGAIRVSEIPDAVLADERAAGWPTRSR